MKDFANRVQEIVNKVVAGKLDDYQGEAAIVALIGEAGVRDTFVGRVLTISALDELRFELEQSDKQPFSALH
jgi:hypothetical protein